MGKVGDIKEALVELRATYSYYVCSSESSMEKAKKELEEAARSEVSAEELRRRIVELEATLRLLEKEK